MEKPSPLTTRKRRRQEEEIEHTVESDSLEENFTFSDTLVALQMMRAQFPSNSNKVSVKPFVLQSQLYSSVKDRTQVDRELESLRRERVLRIFKLNTGQDDHAIMFLDDYLDEIRSIAERMEAKKKDNAAVFEWFKLHVIHSKLETSIEHQELCLLLSIGGKVKDEHVTLLINAGLLTCQLVDPNIYWFTIPNIGSLLKSIAQEIQGDDDVFIGEEEPTVFSLGYEIPSPRSDWFRLPQNRPNTQWLSRSGRKGLKPRNMVSWPS